MKRCSITVKLKTRTRCCIPGFSLREQNLQPWAISQWLWWTFSLKKGRFYQCQPPFPAWEHPAATSELYFMSASSLFLFQQSPLSYFSSYLLSSYCCKFTIFSFPSHSSLLTPTQTPGSCQLPPSLLDMALLMFLFLLYNRKENVLQDIKKNPVICASKAFSS